MLKRIVYSSRFNKLWAEIEKYGSFFVECFKLLCLVLLFFRIQTVPTSFVCLQVSMKSFWAHNLLRRKDEFSIKYKSYFRDDFLDVPIYLLIFFFWMALIRHENMISSDSIHIMPLLVCVRNSTKTSNRISSLNVIRIKSTACKSIYRLSHSKRTPSIWRVVHRFISSNRWVATQCTHLLQTHTSRRAKSRSMPSFDYYYVCVPVAVNPSYR